MPNTCCAQGVFALNLKQRPRMIDPGRALIFSIDFQDKILAAVQDRDEVIAQGSNFIKVARMADVPVLRLEQNPGRLGSTTDLVREALGDARAHPKMTFSALRTPEIESAVRASGRDQIVLLGVEAHICVAQTAFDTIAMGYEVYVLADASSSVKAQDRKLAMDRMRQAGAAITTAQAAAFEIVETAGTPLFKQAQPVLKIL